MRSRAGFTIIEMLLVTGIIGSLASVTILSINPQKQIYVARESARKNTANQIAKAVSQYYIDNGSFPSASITTTGTVSPAPICTQTVTGDSTCMNIDGIAPTYLASVPRETAETNANYAGYVLYAVSGRVAVIPPMRTCRDIHTAYPNAPSGKYQVFGNSLNSFSVYCDMTTDLGGWTIVNGVSGADGEQPIVSDTEVLTGNPLTLTTGSAFNISRAKKVAVNALSIETLIKQANGTWIKMSASPFDNNLVNANSSADKSVIITASNGTSVAGRMGYANFGYPLGGDFGVVTSAGFDHHAPASYYNLNGGCANHYFYSYSASVGDSDAGYDANTTLGAWTLTSSCESGEGGTSAFFIAMR